MIRGPPRFKRTDTLFPYATRFRSGGVPLFGVPAFGVHVNGYVATADGPRLWVGRRAKHKMVAPGKLDHLVAGGQPYGLGLMENVVKEAQEEASIPADLAARARPAGALQIGRAHV